METYDGGSSKKGAGGRDALAETQLSRRAFLVKGGGALGVTLAASAAFAPLAEASRTARRRVMGQIAQDVALSMQWFGQQDGPGLENWVNKAVADYEKAHPNVKISLTLLNPSNVISTLNTASAAHQTPDIHYMWGPIWTLEAVWSDQVTPLNSYWSAAQIKALGPAAKSVTYQRQVWQSTWYGNTQGLAYNKSILKEAGVNASKPIKTWSQFLAACAAVKAAGQTPIVGGAKDGFLGEWLFSLFGSQNVSTLKEMLRPVVGLEKYTDPKWASYLTRIQDLRDKGYFNDDIASVALYEGQNAFAQGKGAFTVAISGQMAGWVKQQPGVVGIMSAPILGVSKTAGWYRLAGPHGLLIPKYAKNGAEAAKFLAFLHEPKRVQQIYPASGLIPTDPTFNPKAITQPAVRAMVGSSLRGQQVAINTVIPSRFETDGLNATAAAFLGGSMDASDVAKKYQQVIELWRAQSPQELKNYQRWYASL
jgi:raffinose/stachyose/melibiose transport system substrate-binding protein